MSFISWQYSSSSLSSLLLSISFLILLHQSFLSFLTSFSPFFLFSSSLLTTSSISCKHSIFVFVLVSFFPFNILLHPPFFFLLLRTNPLPLFFYSFYHLYHQQLHQFLANTHRCPRPHCCFPFHFIFFHTLSFLFLIFLTYIYETLTAAVHSFHSSLLLLLHSASLRFASTYSSVSREVVRFMAAPSQRPHHVNNH